jgi:hypothetical protein
MKFELTRSVEVLERTPSVLMSMLNGLSDDWIMQNEGDDSWSPYDVIGHLIHGEKTDWVPRMEIILSDSTNKTFVPFDRFAQFDESKGKTLRQLLDEFAALRRKNIEHLLAKKISEQDLFKTGVHPAFGQVTLGQLLSTWVVHDLTHISQISRVMSQQYKEEVGPWIEYLRVLNS